MSHHLDRQTDDRLHRQTNRNLYHRKYLRNKYKQHKHSVLQGVNFGDSWVRSFNSLLFITTIKFYFKYFIKAKIIILMLVKVRKSYYSQKWLVNF